MILGLDTASVAGNKNVDWRKAKAGGVSFAFLRSNYGDQQDTAFAREWPRVLEAGITRGAYLYLRHPRGGGKIKAPEPEAQAHAMVKTIGGVQPSDFPPTVDVEFSGDGRAETGLSARQCLDRVGRCVDVLRSTYGCAPILYTSARVWRDDLANLAALGMEDCPLWLARYPFKPGPAKLGAALDGVAAPPVPAPRAGDSDDWWFHQYQGDATSAPGFPSGNVDLNRFNPLVGAFEPLVRPGEGARARWVRDRLNGTTLADFQSQHGLVPDGVIGPRTFAYLAWQP
jgi:GH25 family lysozyme M1 (1,4-beta-N-acetylmuramidase)